MDGTPRNRVRREATMNEDSWAALWLLSAAAVVAVATARDVVDVVAAGLESFRAPPPSAGER
jgi:CBS domain-containing protein